MVQDWCVCQPQAGLSTAPYAAFMRNFHLRARRSGPALLSMHSSGRILLNPVVPPLQQHIGFAKMQGSCALAPSGEM